MKFIHLASLGCGRYEVDETPYSLVVPTVWRKKNSKFSVISNISDFYSKITILIVLHVRDTLGTPCLDVQLSIFAARSLVNKISYLFYLMHTCVLYIKTHVCNDFIIYK